MRAPRGDPENKTPPNKRDILHPGRLTAGTYQSPMNSKENDCFTKPPGKYVPAVNLQGYIAWVVPPAQDSRNHGTSQDFFHIFLGSRDPIGRGGDSFAASQHPGKGGTT